MIFTDYLGSQAGGLGFWCHFTRYVVESTGVFTTLEAAGKHHQGGAEKVWNHAVTLAHLFKIVLVRCQPRYLRSSSLPPLPTRRCLWWVWTREATTRTWRLSPTPPAPPTAWHPLLRWNLATMECGIFVSEWWESALDSANITSVSRWSMTTMASWRVWWPPSMLLQPLRRLLTDPAEKTGGEVGLKICFHFFYHSSSRSRRCTEHHSLLHGGSQSCWQGYPRAEWQTDRCATRHWVGFLAKEKLCLQFHVLQALHIVCDYVHCAIFISGKNYFMSHRHWYFQGAMAKISFYQSRLTLDCYCPGSGIIVQNWLTPVCPRYGIQSAHPWRFCGWPDRASGEASNLRWDLCGIADIFIVVIQELLWETRFQVLKAASEAGPLKGILGYTTDMVVSTDFLGDTRSFRTYFVHTTSLNMK